MKKLIFDKDLIQKYDVACPRYTSYPTAPQFSHAYTFVDYKRAIQESNHQQTPLSLYFHLPFCQTLCYFCACNKIASKNRQKGKDYLKILFQEIAMQSKLIDSTRVVKQLHLGGGTPTFVGDDGMRALMENINKHFTLASDTQGEFAIEIDPREVTPRSMHVLRDIGFNRISIGVQDFDFNVQKAVNRIQPEAMTLSIIEAVRKNNFHSLSVDLIYGLPFQSVATFEKTVKKIIEASPDRIAVFNFAYLPKRFTPQKRILKEDLPTPEEKLEILQNTIGLLDQAGYVYIGMDHFAKQSDALAMAKTNGTLQRNFQGYSTHGACDLIGMGVSAIGLVNNHYMQNTPILKNYEESIRANQFAHYRGFVMNRDDLLRKAVIVGLICYDTIDIPFIEKRFGIDFRDYFATEIAALEKFEEDGLIAWQDQKLQMMPKGRLLVRNACAVFDRYLQKSQQQANYSRAI